MSKPEIKTFTLFIKIVHNVIGKTYCSQTINCSPLPASPVHGQLRDGVGVKSEYSSNALVGRIISEGRRTGEGRRNIPVTIQSLLGMLLADQTVA